MNAYFSRLLLFTFLAGSVVAVNALDVTQADRNKRAAERVEFWQAVVAGLNKTGYKADSDFVKRANTNLTKAEHHAKLVKSGAYAGLLGRSRYKRSGLAGKSKESKVVKAKDSKEATTSKKATKAKKSRSETAKERKAKRDAKRAEAKKKLASSIAATK